jgi:hypothetical protein
MKYTAIVIACLGLALLILAGISAMMIPASTTPNGNVLGAQVGIPVIFGLGALVLAALMHIFGGRGYFVSEDPHIRN